MSQGVKPATKQTCLKLEAISQAEMQNFAQKLATTLSSNDTLFLYGDLGAGKSTFARALIRGIAKDEQLEVPSPTFPLLIPYQTDRTQISHYDLYRLGDPSELEELALFENLGMNLTLIEWPEQLGDHKIKDRLEIWLSEAEQGQSRTLSLIGYGVQAAKLTRFQQMMSFLKATEWSDARWTFLQGDASTRSYIRLNLGGKQALLMNAPPQPDGPPIRDGKPYSQIAHLAEDMTSFVAIANTLGQEAVRVPEIYHHDIENGFLLISDLGDAQYHHLITNEGWDIAKLYEPAIDLLVHLRQLPPNPMSVNDEQYKLPPYDKSALAIETELVTDWYWPHVKKSKCSDAEKANFHSIWTQLFDHLEHDNQHWVLRDFHSPNLMHLETNTMANHKGIATVGVIDFQDAVEGHPAYDVVSLCQDARLTISSPQEQALKQRYIKGALAADTAFNPIEFEAAYAILGAQRASKLLGIFVRLSVRDGKSHYQAHIPRIWQYLERNLSHTQLQPLKNWYDANFPEALRETFFLTHTKA